MTALMTRHRHSQQHGFRAEPTRGRECGIARQFEIGPGRSSGLAPAHANLSSCGTRRGGVRSLPIQGCRRPTWAGHRLADAPAAVSRRWDSSLVVRNGMSEVVTGTLSRGIFKRSEPLAWNYPSSNRRPLLGRGVSQGQKNELRLWPQFVHRLRLTDEERWTTRQPALQP